MALPSAENAPCWAVNACPDWCRRECEAILRQPAASPAPRPVLRVLVVDDEALQRWSACLALRRAGHQVRLADSVEQAFQVILDDDGLDLAIVDWRLPQGDGLDIARLLRRVQPACTVCLVSIGVTWRLEQEALAMGAQCLSKPIDAVALAARVSPPLRPGPPGLDIPSTL